MRAAKLDNIFNMTKQKTENFLEKEKSPSEVRKMRLELTRPCGHYPLKVACIPISPLAHDIH